MAIGYAELERFYQELVRKLRERGVTCAITSGMACVHYGVTDTTKDCDLLCSPETAERCLDLLSETVFAGIFPSYRGNISPPLDARWMRGGWTSHFLWKSGGEESYLDVFGVAPRGTSPWENKGADLYADAHVVAEMKRTNRDKDWPMATALGVNLLDAGDPRGWLHIFDAEVLTELLERLTIPESILALRPVLALAVEHDDRLKPAVRVEREFWYELDRARIRVYERALRPYVAAVRRSGIAQDASLHEQHRVRVSIAEELLPTDPFRKHGLEPMIQESKSELVKLGMAEYIGFLPNVENNFRILIK
jgi:hypothetical protein